MNWIWIKEQEKNTFAEFLLPFSYERGEVTLRISADYRYFALLGDRVVSFGQYADLPSYKCFNTADLTPFVKKGENVLRVLAWHVGEDFFVCRTMSPSVAFAVAVDGKTVAASNEHTRCRRAAGYLAGDKITPQIGTGYHYDFSKAAGAWENATLVKTDFVETPRPIKQTTIGELCVSKIVAQGVFQYRETDDPAQQTAAANMQNAWLASARFCEMTGENRMERDTLTAPITFTGKGGDGVFLVADTGREICGHLGFTVRVDKPCKMLLGWGEHLSDLRVRTKIGPRNFGIEFTLQAGENVFDDYFLRLGGRYLCLFVEAEKVTLTRLGIREVGYPFDFVEKDFGDKLYNAIYETGRRTMYLSAHEHYEDCPWREQALYGMDSRNQMLFGYGAFHEYELPRASMLLIAKCLQEDGMIPLCAPSRTSICIPSFSSYWLIAIAENAEVDYDEGFVREILPVAEKCLDAFLARECEEGIRQLAEPAYWNFHEWSDGLDGGQIWRDKPLEKAWGDCNLTALTAIAAEKLAWLEKKQGNVEKAEAYRLAAARLKACLEQYYDEEKGAYASYIHEEAREGYHAYTQAVVLWSGCVPTARKQTICASLKDTTGKIVPITLAGLQMKYKALLDCGELAYCMQDIESLFGGMLLQGATSYWETEKGEADFVDAGSLCHGWAAVACWVMDTYLKN